MNMIDNATTEKNPAEGMAGNPFTLEPNASAIRKENHALAVQVGQIALRNRWSKTETARRAGMPVGTFSPWFDGNYKGDVKEQNRRIINWLAAIEEEERVISAMPVSPGFVPTKFANTAMDMFRTAQVLPAMVMITAEAGIGKTCAAEQYKATGQNVYLINMNEHTRNPNGMLMQLAEEVGCQPGIPVRMVNSIARRLQRRGAGTLLIVDEIQHLTDQSVNQLRYFLDNHGTGIALVGNSETYGRFATWSEKKNFAQLRSRVFKRQLVMTPSLRDIEALADAWGVSDVGMRRYLAAIGKKPGALRNIDQTMKLATMLARGNGESVQLAHLQRAWSNRDTGDAS